MLQERKSQHRYFSNMKKTLDINTAIFLTGSAEIFTVPRCMCAHVWVAYDTGTQTGGGPEHSRAAGEEGCSSTKKLPTPHLEKSPTGAQAMALPSVCLLQSRPPLLGAEKKLAHGGGLSLPCCTEVGCRLLGVTCRDQAALFCPPSLILVSSVWIPVLFILPFSFWYLLPSLLFPGDNRFLPPPILFYADLACFWSSAVLSRGCLMNWHSISFNNYFVLGSVLMLDVPWVTVETSVRDPIYS